MIFLILSGGEEIVLVMSDSFTEMKLYDFIASVCSEFVFRLASEHLVTLFHETLCMIGILAAKCF